MVRKHTGERPFQCHCSRRFSRLDNLRQHAQTVHVNEDIPIDSLAATGTRFQRQIRTDRVRASNGRARASTLGTMGGPGRGHAKSLSTSSISSVGSAYSTREDVRRRPAPLVMAEPRSRFPTESYQRSPGEGVYAYRPVSPSEFSTPTSATFSTEQSSPRWGSAIASPTSSHSRSHSMYASGRAPARRLSVPGGIPFQSPHGATLGRPLFGPGSTSTSTKGPYSPNSSVMASPTSSAFPRRESAVSSADEAWRRRTWHLDSTNFGGAPSSRLSNVYTPSQFQSPVPGGTPPRADQGSLQGATLRLPGIESFDAVPHRPATPPRRNPSPMMVDADSPHPLPLLPAADVGAQGPRNTANWDMGLHRGLTRLDLRSNKTPPRDGASAWAQEANQAVEAEAERARLNPPTVRFNEPVVIHDAPPVRTNSPARPFHQHTMSAPAFSRPREAKRHGWYNNPVQVHADGPPGKIARVERMVHPNINQFPGFPAREAPPAPEPAKDAPGDRDNLLRLQALVAVATSEGNATTAY